MRLNNVFRTRRSVDHQRLSRISHPRGSSRRRKLFLESLEDRRLLAPLAMDYYVVPAGPVYQYSFTVKVDNHDSSFVPGQGWGWLTFGDVPGPGMSPIADFALTSPAPSPWTGITASSGGHNGPTLNPVFNYWYPSGVGDSRTWTGTSATDVPMGSMKFSTLVSQNGAVLANFEVATRVAAPPLTAAFDGSGNLVITDTDAIGKNNNLTASVSGGNLVVTDANWPFAFAPAGGTLSNGNKTLTIPFASITGSQVIFNTAGGSDTLTENFAGGGFSKQIVYNGGGGVDSLVFQNGSFSNTIYNYTNSNDGSVSLDGHSTIYTGLSPITSTITAANVTLNYSTAAEMITVTNPGGGQTTVNSTAAELTTFNNPTSSLTINAGNTGNDIININGLAANYPASLIIDGQGGTDVINQNVALVLGSALASRDLTYTAEFITLGGNIDTDDNANAGSVAVNGNVTLTAGVVIQADGTTSDGNVYFGGTVNGARALTVNAGDNTGNNTITLNGPVGGGIPLSSLEINGGLLLLNAGAITTTGLIDLEDVDILLDSPSNTTTLTSTGGGNILVGFANSPYVRSTIDGVEALVVNTAGRTELDSRFGTNNQRLSSITTDAAGTLSIDAVEINTTGSQTYNEAAAFLQNSLTATSTSGGNITFAGTLDENVGAIASNLTVDTDGSVAFGGAVGLVTPLDSITVSDSSGINIAAAMTSVGSIAMNSAGSIIQASGVVTSQTGGVNMTAGGGISTTGITAATNALLQATAGGISSAGGGIVSAVNLVATAGTGITLDTMVADINASVTGAGAIIIDEADAVTLSDVDTVGGNITIDAAGQMTATDVQAGGSGDVRLTTTVGDILLGDVRAAADLVTIIAAGAIMDSTGGEAANITALETRLQASTGIGNAAVDALDIDIDVTNVAAATTTGDISLQDPAVLTITMVDGLTGVAINAGGAGDDVLIREGKQAGFDDLEIFGNVWNAGPGNITIFADGTVNDDIRLGANVQASGGDILIVSFDSVVMWTNGNTISTTGAGTLAIHAGQVLSFGGGLSPGDPSGIIDGNLDYFFLTESGNIRLTAPDGIGLRTVNADSDAIGIAGTVIVTADSNNNGTGQITDRLISEGANITGAAAVLRAAQGIGKTDSPTNDLELSVSMLSALNTTSGDITIDNLVGSLLTIGTVDGLPGVTNLGSGIVDISNASPLTVAANVLGVGAITLTAFDSAGPGDDLTVNGGGVFVQSTGSSVTLNAGDNALIDGNLTAATTVTVNGDFGNTDPGLGSTVTINGVVTTGGGAFVNGNVDSDTFNLAAQTTTSFDIQGNNPTLPTLPGDTLNLDISGTSNPALTLGMNPGSGTFSFDPTYQDVAFNSIETLDTNGVPYHLVLDMITSGFGGGPPFDVINIQLNAAGTVLEIAINGNPFFQGQMADIRSLTVLGSADQDDLRIQETAGGLPSFPDAAPGSILGSNGSHLNASAQYFLDTVFGGPFTVSDVGIHFDGRAGMDLVRLNLITNHDAAHFADNLDAAGSGNLGTYPVGGVTPDLLMSFANTQELLLMGTNTGGLLVDSSSLDINQLTINAGANPLNGFTLIQGDNGFTATSFGGFADVQVSSGVGDDLIDLQSLDAAGGIVNIRIDGNNVQGTDIGNDTLRIRSTLPGVSAQVWGGLGNDLIQLFDTAPTVDNIGGPVLVDGQGGNDTLIVDDSGSPSGDIVSINESTIEGMTGAPGTDVTFVGIEDLTVSTSGGGDLVSADFTTGGSSLVVVTINGSDGDDTINVRDDANLGEPVVDLATLTINGNAGSDTFNQPTGPANPNPNTDPRGKLLPSLTTAIFVNGEAGPTGSGNPTSPPNGDTDTFNLDVTALTAPVIVDTIAGIATSAGPHQNVYFSGIEDLCLDDVTRDDVNVSIGELYVRTTNDRERITFTSWNDMGVKLRIDNLDNGSSITFPEHFGLAGGVQMLQRIVTFAQDGNDLVSIAGHVVDGSGDPIPVEFHGEGGDDYLTGANGDDILVGGPGNDRLLGGEGDNRLYGDGNVLDPNGIPIELPTDGNDNLSGRSGNDIIFGGGGNDQLFGGDGNDYLHAGGGNDFVDGGLDDDVLIGAAGNDNLSGNYGNDILLGGIGADQLFGRQGNDVLLGGNDIDTVRGDAGNDLVVGGNASNVNDTTTDAALRAILAEWVSNNPAVPVGLGTLQLDGVQDLLIGDTGADAFHESALPELINEDRVYDFRASDGDTLLP